MNTLRLCLVAGMASGVLFAMPAMAEMERMAPAEGAEVYIISPADGATVASPVTVRMGLRGMGVAPAGTQSEGTGHHHLLVDTALDDVDLDVPLPSDAQHRHFGGGQTEAEVELSPGEHTLQLLFMDYRHVSFEPPVASEAITITVE